MDWENLKAYKQIATGISSVAQHLDILPAWGVASQDLLRADEEEIEDLLLARDDETLSMNQTEFFETDPPSAANPFRSTPPLSRTEDHLFRYFMDGSAHSRSIGFGTEGPRAFPIAFFQIGAAVVERSAEGVLHPKRLLRKNILTVQTGSGGLSDTLWNQVDMTRSSDMNFEIVPISLQTDSRRDMEDIRPKSNSVAFGRMHKLELDICDEIKESLHESCRVILDGSVKIGSIVSSPYIIGVAKSFWRMPNVAMMSQGSKKLDVVQLLAMLPQFCRTPVFKAAGGSVGFWYVRLRSIQSMGSPLRGVIKVEIPCLTKEYVPSEEADRISRCLVAERLVTAYGLDKRWPSMIYPIHYAENIIKGGFIPEDVLDTLIRLAIQSRQGVNHGNA